MVKGGLTMHIVVSPEFRDGNSGNFRLFLYNFKEFGARDSREFVYPGNNFLIPVSWELKDSVKLKLLHALEVICRRANFSNRKIEGLSGNFAILGCFFTIVPQHWLQIPSMTPCEDMDRAKKWPYVLWERGFDLKVIKCDWEEDLACSQRWCRLWTQPLKVRRTGHSSCMS